MVVPATPKRRRRLPASVRDDAVGRLGPSGVRGLELAALDLLGEFAPLLGDPLQAFLGVGVGRAPGLSFGLSRMLAILIGS
jgi:hypothetical protein